MTARLRLRPGQPEDLPGMRAVCLATGAAGGSVHDRPDRPDLALLVPAVYVDPYLALEPRGVTVVVDGDGVAGYAVTVADTRIFHSRWLAQAADGPPWAPASLPASVPVAVPPPDGPDGRAAALLALLHDPRPLRPPDGTLDLYPAHLRVALLPRAQGRGLGRAMVETACAALAAAEAPGVHVDTEPVPAASRAFWLAVGFESAPGSRWLTRRLR